MKKISFGLTALFLGLTFAACVPRMESPELVSNVVLNRATASMVANTTLQLTYTIQPASALNKKVSWTTSNSNVATVSTTGVVTAKAVGTAVITVTTEDGNKTAKCTITVTAAPVPVSGVAVTPANVTLNIGGTQTLSANITPANATNKSVTWTTSNASVATVNSSGIVTAVSAGTAIIKVITAEGNKEASCTVTVNLLTEDVRALIPDDLLEILLEEFGMEINGGINPPNIEGTYLVSPCTLVNTNIPGGLAPGYVYDDLTITFSNQNNTNLTVDCEYFIGNPPSINRSGLFITGSGNKFSVFVEVSEIEFDAIEGFYTVNFVEIYSGEITSTPSGIKNFYLAEIFKLDVVVPSLVERGQGFLIFDSDGFSEKIAATKAPFGTSSNAHFPLIFAKKD